MQDNSVHVQRETVPVNDDLGEMLNWAVRYALGRRTYAVMDTCKYVTPLIPYLSDRTLHCMVRDIQEQSNYGYGDVCDKEYWMMLLEDLEKELEGRVNDIILDAIG